MSAEEQVSTLRTGDAFGGSFAQRQCRFFHKEENRFVSMLIHTQHTGGGVARNSSET